MYLISLALVLVLGLIAAAWSPIFALIIAVPAFFAFLLYIGMQRRADEKIDPPTGGAQTVESDPGTHKGAWGEPRP
jgi:hypothetical protein